MVTKSSAKGALLFSLMLLAACAGGKSGSPAPSGEYVEITNPMQTMSPDAPATIWVPANAEKGVPRGSVLVKEGVQMAKEGFTGVTSVASSSPVAAVAVTAPVVPITGVVTSPVAASASFAPAVPSGTVKKLIAVIEVGDNHLVTTFSDQVRTVGVGVPVDLGEAGRTAATVAKESDRLAFAGQLWKDNTAAVLIRLSAPGGVGSGTPLVADIYDGIQGTGPRRVSVRIPGGADGKGASLAAACDELARRVNDVVTLTPWYGRIFEVDGVRIYLNAGRESGLQLGQKLKVYRGGKVVAGIGFDPGSEVATLVIAGFLGTNGSYGVVKDGQSVTVSDTVSN